MPVQPPGDGQTVPEYVDTTGQAPTTWEKNRNNFLGMSRSQMGCAVQAQGFPHVFSNIRGALANGAGLCSGVVSEAAV